MENPIEMDDLVVPPFMKIPYGIINTVDNWNGACCGYPTIAAYVPIPYK